MQITTDLYKHYLSIGAGLTLGNIKSHYPKMIYYPAGRPREVIYKDQNKWRMGSFLYLKYNYILYQSIFTGVSFYYYNINGFKDQPDIDELSVTGLNFNLNIGFRF